MLKQLSKLVGVNLVCIWNLISVIVSNENLLPTTELGISWHETKPLDIFKLLRSAHAHRFNVSYYCKLQMAMKNLEVLLLISCPKTKTVTFERQRQYS